MSEESSVGLELEYEKLCKILKDGMANSYAECFEAEFGRYEQKVIERFFKFLKKFNGKQEKKFEIDERKVSEIIELVKICPRFPCSIYEYAMLSGNLELFEQSFKSVLKKKFSNKKNQLSSAGFISDQIGIQTRHFLAFLSYINNHYNFRNREITLDFLVDYKIILIFSEKNKISLEKNDLENWCFDNTSVRDIDFSRAKNVSKAKFQNTEFNLYSVLSYVANKSFTEFPYTISFDLSIKEFKFLENLWNCSNKKTVVKKNLTCILEMIDDDEFVNNVTENDFNFFLELNNNQKEALASIIENQREILNKSFEETVPSLNESSGSEENKADEIKSEKQLEEEKQAAMGRRNINLKEQTESPSTSGSNSDNEQTGKQQVQELEEQSAEKMSEVSVETQASVTLADTIQNEQEVEATAEQKDGQNNQGDLGEIQEPIKSVENKNEQGNADGRPFVDKKEIKQQTEVETVIPKGTSLEDVITPSTKEKKEDRVDFQVLRRDSTLDADPNKVKVSSKQEDENLPYTVDANHDEGSSSTANDSGIVAVANENDDFTDVVEPSSSSTPTEPRDDNSRISNPKTSLTLQQLSIAAIQAMMDSPYFNFREMVENKAVNNKKEENSDQNKNEVKPTFYVFEEKIATSNKAKKIAIFPTTMDRDKWPNDIASNTNKNFKNSDLQSLPLKDALATFVKHSKNYNEESKIDFMAIPIATRREFKFPLSWLLPKFIRRKLSREHFLTLFITKNDPKKTNKPYTAYLNDPASITSAQWYDTSYIKDAIIDAFGDIPIQLHGTNNQSMFNHSDCGIYSFENIIKCAEQGRYIYPRDKYEGKSIDAESPVSIAARSTVENLVNKAFDDKNSLAPIGQDMTVLDYNQKLENNGVNVTENEKITTYKKIDDQLNNGEGSSTGNHGQVANQPSRKGKEKEEDIGQNEKKGIQQGVINSNIDPKKYIKFENSQDLSDFSRERMKVLEKVKEEKMKENELNKKKLQESFEKTDFYKEQTEKLMKAFEEDIANKYIPTSRRGVNLNSSRIKTLIEIANLIEGEIKPGAHEKAIISTSIDPVTGKKRYEYEGGIIRNLLADKIYRSPNFDRYSGKYCKAEQAYRLLLGAMLTLRDETDKDHQKHHAKFFGTRSRLVDLFDKVLLKQNVNESYKKESAQMFRNNRRDISIVYRTRKQAGEEFKVKRSSASQAA